MVDSGTAVSPQPGQTRWSSPTETCIARRDPKDRLHRTAEGNSHNTEPWLTWFARLSAQPSALHHICYGRRSPQVARDMWSKCPGFWPGLRTCRSNSNVIWPKLVLMMMMMMMMMGWWLWRLYIVMAMKSIVFDCCPGCCLDWLVVETSSSFWAISEGREFPRRCPSNHLGLGSFTPTKTVRLKL